MFVIDPRGATVPVLSALLLLSAGCCPEQVPYDDTACVPPDTDEDDSDVANPDRQDVDGDGWTPVQGDCDDRDPSVHPEAAELWYDGVDADCDGASDYDADEDGYDAESYGGSDCEDRDATIHPDAEEDVHEGLDRDCDGEVTNILDLDAEIPLLGENAGAVAGVAVCGASDLNGDGYDDLLVSARGSPAGSSNGAVYLFLGPTTGPNLGVADSVLVGSPDSMAGSAIAGLGDVNGDGRDDFVIGAYKERAFTFTMSGGAFVWFGRPVFPPQDTAVNGDAAIFAWQDESAAYSVAGAGDVNGDNRADILVSVVVERDSGASVNAAYLWLGPVAGSNIVSDGDSALLLGEDEECQLPGFHGAGAGDMNGDGLDDILVGWSMMDAHERDVGGAYVVLAPVNTDLILDDADGIWTGEAGGDYAGYAISSAGDNDGDGYADILVGAYGNDAAGAAAGATYLLTSPADGSAPLAEARATLTGVRAGDMSGSSVSGAGDFDGDGFDDLLVGASGAGGEQQRRGRGRGLVGAGVGDVGGPECPPRPCNATVSSTVFSSPAGMAAPPYRTHTSTSSMPNDSSLASWFRVEPATRSSVAAEWAVVSEMACSSSHEPS